MSLDPPQAQELVAIAFVVESSLQIAHEWLQNSVYQYCINLLRRLSETNSPSALKIAFVTYATANTVPSPILAKRYFVNCKEVLSEMAKDIASFGVGSTNSGGSTGMAALEGIVAALELFDLLQPPGATPAGRNIHAHLIHIASAIPDASVHPQFNESDSLDDVSWDTLPQELKKRNINYSTFNLKPKLPKYPELYAATVTGGASPWFTVRPTHTVLLAPFGASPNSNNKGSGAKRTGESATADTAKRPRLQPATPTATAVPPSAPAPMPSPPKPASKMIVPSVAPIVAPSASMPTQPQPPVPSQPVGTSAGASMPSASVPAQTASAAAMLPKGAPGPAAAPAPAPGPGQGATNQLQTIAAVLGARGPEMLLRFRSNMEQIKLLEVEIKNATEKGDTKRAETLAAEQNTKKGLHLQFTNLFAQAKAQAIRRAQQGQGQGQQGPSPSQAPGQQSSPPQQGQGQEQLGQQPQSSPPAQPPQQVTPHVQELGSPFTMNVSSSNGSSSGGPSTLVPPTGAPGSSPIAVLPMGHARSTSTAGSIDGLAGLGISAMPPGAPPGMTSLSAQYQKMFEQRNRMTSGGQLAPPLPLRGGIPASVAPTGGPPGAGGTQPFGIAGPSGQPQGADGMQQGQQPPTAGAAQKLAQHVQVWQGALKWSGKGTNGKKELQCFVAILSATPETCHADTWPPVLQLTPTPDGMPITELSPWMKRHQPALCAVQLQTAGVADPKTNEENYQQLVVMLGSRKKCATAAWTTPTGSTSNNVLIVPMATRNLVAAFFPLTGLPELPKAPSAPLQLLDRNNMPMAQLPIELPQHHIASLNSLEPNTRLAVLHRMMKTKQMQQAQAQQVQVQQQQPSQQQMMGHGQELGSPFGMGTHVTPPNGMPGGMGMGMANPMTANMNAALNMMGQQGAPGGGATAGGMMMGGPAGQMPLRMGAQGVGGMGMGGMPFDIMQSFMKRSGDGNPGMGG